MRHIDASAFQFGVARCCPLSYALDPMVLAGEGGGHPGPVASRLVEVGSWEDTQKLATRKTYPLNIPKQLTGRTCFQASIFTLLFFQGGLIDVNKKRSGFF